MHVQHRYGPIRSSADSDRSANVPAFVRDASSVAMVLVLLAAPPLLVGWQQDIAQPRAAIEMASMQLAQLSAP